jgi:hypothetical protein
LHFHCAQRSVALPKQVFFAADKRGCTRIGAPEVTKSANSDPPDGAAHPRLSPLIGGKKTLALVNPSPTVAKSAAQTQ